MALISCKECGHQISSKSSTCVGCGAPNAKGRSTSLIAIFSLLFILVNIIMGLVFISAITGNNAVIYVASTASAWGSLSIATGLPIIMLKMK